jgi:putative oxidoreductase
MKKLFSVSYNAGLANIWLLVYRIAASAFLLTHGYPKFIKLISGSTIQFADPFGVGAYPSFVMAVFAEFVCTILIILGLGTRLASIFVVITMAVAVFYAHAADPFGKKEMALLYLITFLTILVLGPGKYSLDQLIAGSSSKGRRR